MNEEQYNLLRNVRDNAEMKLKEMYPEFKELKTRFHEFEEKYGQLWNTKDKADRAMAEFDGRLKRVSSGASGVRKKETKGTTIDIIIRNLSVKDLAKLADKISEKEEESAKLRLVTRES
jgi:hypothetical protein